MKRRLFLRADLNFTLGMLLLAALKRGKLDDAIDVLTKATRCGQLHAAAGQLAFHMRNRLRTSVIWWQHAGYTAHDKTNTVNINSRHKLVINDLVGPVR